MKKSFTLSEVLISLVIIGVVAAITVPIIYAQYTEQERIAKVKKTYSSLANVMTRVKADGGDYILDYDLKDDTETINKWFNTYLKPYLSTTKICYNSEGCWAYPSYTLSGNVKSDSNTRGIGSPIVTAILNDGVFIDVDRTTSAQFGVNFDNENYCIAVYFDINGDRKPNTLGKDIFVTVFTDKGLVPAGRDATSSQVLKSCSSSSNGLYCIIKYLKK